MLSPEQLPLVSRPLVENQVFLSKDHSRGLSEEGVSIQRNILNYPLRDAQLTEEWWHIVSERETRMSVEAQAEYFKQEISGALSSERTRKIPAPLSPRVPGAINTYGPNGEHTVTYLEENPPAVLKVHESAKSDSSEQKAVESVVIFEQELAEVAGS